MNESELNHGAVSAMFHVHQYNKVVDALSKFLDIPTEDAVAWIKFIEAHDGKPPVEVTDE